MIPPIAKVIYEARRALEPMKERITEDGDGITLIENVPKLPFDELTSGEREPMLAEVQLYLQSGADMDDALGKAIVEAMK
jgi:hypothetical protein